MAAAQQMKRQQADAQVCRVVGAPPHVPAATPATTSLPLRRLPPAQNHHVQQQQQVLAAQQQSANQEERAYVAQLQEVLNNQASALQQQVVESANTNASKAGSPTPTSQPGPEFGAEGKAADVDGIGADVGAPKGNVAERLRTTPNKLQAPTNKLRTNKRCIRTRKDVRQLRTNESLPNAPKSPSPPSPSTATLADFWPRPGEENAASAPPAVSINERSTRPAHHSDRQQGRGPRGVRGGAARGRGALNARARGPQPSPHLRVSGFSSACGSHKTVQELIKVRTTYEQTHRCGTFGCEAIIRGELWTSPNQPGHPLTHAHPPPPLRNSLTRTSTPQ